MKRDTLRQIITVIAVLATIVVNALANILPFNGQETGAISDRFAIYFVPAGYVFSIWGLIYLGLIAYAIFQALPAQRENPRLRSIGGLFALASVANIVWIFLWHYEVFPATLAVMLVLLGSLDCDLPAPGHRPDAGQPSGNVDGQGSVQCLSGVDYRGDGRQCHPTPLLPGLEWRGARP